MKRILTILTVLTALLMALLPAAAPALAEATEAPAGEAVETAQATEAPAEEAAETEEEAEPTWAEEAFGNLTGMHWYTAAIVAVLLVMGILMCTQKKDSWTTRRLAYAAMCIAIAFVLSCIKLFRMPQGGSVTPASMLPLILFALACGPVQGLVVGCAFGLLQLVEDFYVIHPVQLLVDYPMAFAALALACLANLLPVKSDRIKLPVAVLLGYFGRYIMATISGAVFFADGLAGFDAWKFSLGYNLSYLGWEALIAVLLSCIPGFTRILNLMRRKV